MNIQEAYNKGLDDSENRIMDILEKVLRYEDSEGFMNPRLEAIRKAIKVRSDYYVEFSRRNNNPSKYFRKMIEEQLSEIDKTKV
jgi:hypothetical protein